MSITELSEISYMFGVMIMQGVVWLSSLAVVVGDSFSACFTLYTAAPNNFAYACMGLFLLLFLPLLNLHTYCHNLNGLFSQGSTVCMPDVPGMLYVMLRW